MYPTTISLRKGSHAHLVRLGGSQKGPLAKLPLKQLCLSSAGVRPSTTSKEQRPHAQQDVTHLTSGKN